VRQQEEEEDTSLTIVVCGTNPPVTAKAAESHRSKNTISPEVNFALHAESQQPKVQRSMRKLQPSLAPPFFPAIKVLDDQHAPGSCFPFPASPLLYQGRVISGHNFFGFACLHGFLFLVRRVVLSRRIGKVGAARPRFRFPESCNVGRRLLIGRS